MIDAVFGEAHKSAGDEAEVGAPLFPSANPKILIGQRELDVQTYILPIKSPAESTYQWRESLGDTTTYSIRGYRLHIQHIPVLLRRI
jgi:hypothetical protein